jgi:hypothetical protein
MPLERARVTRMTVAPPIDRQTVYYSRKCLKPIFDHVPRFVAILGFLPDFATDFDFLTLGF